MKYSKEFHKNVIYASWLSGIFIFTWGYWFYLPLVVFGLF